MYVHGFPSPAPFLHVYVMSSKLKMEQWTTPNNILFQQEAFRSEDCRRNEKNSESATPAKALGSCTCACVYTIHSSRAYVTHFYTADTIKPSEHTNLRRDVCTLCKWPSRHLVKSLRLQYCQTQLSPTLHPVAGSAVGGSVR